MKFSLVLLLTALCSVEYVNAGVMSAETITGVQLGEAAWTDQYKIAATLTTAITNENIVVTTTSAMNVLLADKADAATLASTDYTIKCDGTAFTPTSATVSGTKLIVTIVHTQACIIGKVLEITFLKAKITGDLTGIAGTISTASDTVATTGSTSVVAKKGTFATMVTASLTVAAVAGKDSTTTTLQFTGSTLAITTGKFTVSLPGYSLAAGNQCTLTATTGTNPTVAVTGSSADVSPWEFTLLTQAMTAQIYTFACNKVTAPAAAQAAMTAAVIVGETIQTLPILGSYTLPLVATAAPTAAAFSAAPASAGGSMVAVVLGSFAALCLLF